jgi:hypothetical protein|tara:strand:+ start:1373 stop:2014 length:642 start_codon:yes stop_codon:yes gene_type:complete
MIVIDDYLKPNFQLELCKSYLTLPTYNFWSGWWNEPPRNDVEYVLELLWKPYIDIDKYKDGGLEYWSRPLYNTVNALEWHQDDISDHERENNYELADLSLIYYPKVSHDSLGGFLEIAPYNERGTYESSIRATKNIDQVQVERIRPLTDRCVIFDSAQLHRVSPQYRGKRYNLASTLWKTKHKRFDVSENLVFRQVDVVPVDWEYKYERNIKK